MQSNYIFILYYNFFSIQAILWYFYVICVYFHVETLTKEEERATFRVVTARGEIKERDRETKKNSSF